MGIITYLRETKAEMKHVSWPTRKQAFSYTAVVIVLAVATAILLGIFDEFFAFIVSKLIS